MDKNRANPINIRFLNGVFISIITVCWFSIFISMVNGPFFRKTLEAINYEVLNLYVRSFISHSRDVFLYNSLPNIILIIISVMGLCIIYRKKGQINYLEKVFMKTIFSGMILTSIFFMAVFFIPEPVSLEFLEVRPSVSTDAVFQFNLLCLSVISIALISISLLVFFLIDDLNNRPLRIS